MEVSSKRNSFSDMMNVAQIYIPVIRMTLQEAPMIGMCLMNIRDERKPKISKGKLLPPH